MTISFGDRDPAGALKAADPACGDPGYWSRFHASVADRAAVELAMRRRRARESVQAILSAWSRPLIPLAVAAAVAAALLAVEDARRRGRPGPAVAMEPPALALEDVLDAGVGDGSLRAVLAGELHATQAAFMTVVEGNP